MADKYINQTGLQTIKTWIEGKFGTKTEVTAVDTKVDNLSDRVDEIIAEGGEPNVIEKIKLNGTDQTVTNKTVDLEVVSIDWEEDRTKIMKKGGLSSAVEFIDKTEGAELSFGKGSASSQTRVYKTLVDKTYVDSNKASLAKSNNPAGATGEETTYTVSQGSDNVSFNYTEDGGTLSNYVNVNLGDDLFQVATTNYVDANGGKIDKIKVNGTEQTITNKEVNLLVPQVQSTATAVQINNGEQTQGIRFVETANGYTIEGLGDAAPSEKELVSKTYVGNTFRTEAQVQSAIDASLADITGIDFKIVTELPATGVKGTIYLLEDGAHAGTYVEYIWIDGDPTGRFEKIGTTEADLTDYWTSVDGKTNSLVAMTVAEITAILEPTNP